jgi:EAL domain-containing protein (putative c-di-GMP-specific phosphodiesterase class I)/CheY-like chemotaxis protein
LHDTVRLTELDHVAGTILLVEDDAAVARSLVRWIRSEGYDVVHAASGAAAIDAVMNRTFDAVLSDLHLPGTTGIDVLDVVRAYDKDVPLVLMTGDPTTDTAIAACRLGVIEYLVKPMTPDALSRVLKRATAARGERVSRHEVDATRRAPVRGDAATLPSMGAGVPPRRADATGSLSAAFERAMASLTVELEPIVGVRIGLVGFAARMSSSVETLSTEAALVVAADELGRLVDLRRRARDIAVKSFVDAPSGSLLFMDVHRSDLVDGDLYASDPPLARIADRVVLQLRASDPAISLADLRARLGVLRFMGYRVALTDLEGGQARLSQLAELAPEIVKIDPRLVRGIDAAPHLQRVVTALVAMCRSLGATPIAEGVSTAEERNALVLAGCEIVQGALVARHGLRRAPPSSGVRVAGREEEAAPTERRARYGAINR